MCVCTYNQPVRLSPKQESNKLICCSGVNQEKHFRFKTFCQAPSHQEIIGIISFPSASVDSQIYKIYKFSSWNSDQSLQFLGLGPWGRERGNSIVIDETKGSISVLFPFLSLFSSFVLQDSILNTMHNKTLHIYSCEVFMIFIYIKKDVKYWSCRQSESLIKKLLGHAIIT